MSENIPRKRIVILGGGFGGVYTAIALEKRLRRRDDVEVVLVSKEKYVVFQPMLAEIVSGSIGMLDTISPLHRLLPRTQLYIRDIDSIDLENKTVTLGPGFQPRPLVLPFDHLVLALGSVTDFRGIPGIHAHALPFKTLADAVHLRNHLIDVLSEAQVEKDPDLRKELLTFVVAGGGFSGVEVAAEMNDFLRRVAKQFRLTKSDIRVILVHSGDRVLEREMPESLGLYAQKALARKGVELLLQSRLVTASPGAAVLSGGKRIATRTLVSTVPSSPNPLIESLDVAKKRGKVEVDRALRAKDAPSLWALGDCMAMESLTGEGLVPPTAQHATRQAAVLADNIVATLDGKPLREYAFKGLGTIGSLGYRSAVALLFNSIKLSGFPAWIIWRAIYWMKLPGLDRKLRVGISWFLDLVIPPETVQLKMGGGGGVSQVHYEAGEVIFRQGDLGDALYIILKGNVEVLLEEDGKESVIARLGDGEYFGEMALLKERSRSATIRCTGPTDLLALRQGDFHTLVANLPEMRHGFTKVMRKRLSTS